MKPVFKTLAAHKGKTFLAAMFTAGTLLLSRGCSLTIDRITVKARTNAPPPAAIAKTNAHR